MLRSALYNNDKKINLCSSRVLVHMFGNVCFNMCMFRLAQVMKLFLDISATDSWWEIVLQSLEHQILLLFLPGLMGSFNQLIGPSGAFQSFGTFHRAGWLRQSQSFFRIYCLSQASLHFLISSKHLLELLENVCL